MHFSKSFQITNTSLSKSSNSIKDKAHGFKFVKSFSYVLFLCLFYIWWNFGIYSAFIEFHIAFLKGNVIFFQAVRIVCLPVLQGFFRNFVILIFFFHFLPLFKSYEKIDIFLKQFPHLKHVVVGELKTKSSKNLFKKLNEHSKDLQTKQEEIIKKHNSLAAQYEELEHLKNNMNEYLGRGKTEKRNQLLEQLRNIKGK